MSNATGTPGDDAKRDYSKQWHLANKARRNVDSRKWYRENRDAHIAATRANQLKRKHGLTPEAWISLYIAQQGRCYLCELPFGEHRDPDVEHDHRCCGQDASCNFCRRGLSCNPCNRLISYAADDPGRLILIAANLRAAKASAEARMARCPVQEQMFDNDTQAKG